MAGNQMTFDPTKSFTDQYAPTPPSVVPQGPQRWVSSWWGRVADAYGGLAQELILRLDDEGLQDLALQVPRMSAEDQRRLAEILSQVV